MDDILRKNIFNINDLHRLTPDYRPVNLYLRMQMRRALVKDTHFHGVNKCNLLQRRLTKDGNSKLNKEIVKLRNAFHNINLKNEVMFKSIKSKSYLRDVDLLLNHHSDEVLNDSIDIMLDKLPNESNKLIIQNDKDFKINTKIKPMKLKISLNESNNNTQTNEHDLDLKFDDEETSNIIKIECKYVDRHSESDTSEPYEDINDNTNYISQKPVETTIYDLQSLLNMMTLTSKTNHSNETYSVEDDRNKSAEPILENLNIQNSFTKCTGGINEILNVKQILVDGMSHEKNTMKKYVDKWKKYVRKRQDNIDQQRHKVLTSFFDKLEKKKSNINHISDPVNKAKVLARDYSTYQHRYKVQKHVIALQKAKLEEQHRLIEELKYNKIIEASKQSVDEMREEVRKTYYEIDRHLKPKIKCLTNELKIPEIDQSTIALQCLKVPQFLQRMEKRAREREEKHAMIRERRRQMEEERLRLKQQAELVKAEMDKDEKLKRMKELREKRKKEKIDNIRKKQFAERMRALTVMVDLHYEKRLLLKYGINPLKRLLELKQDNIDKAKTHFEFQLKKNIFLHFMWYTEDMVFERNFKAEEFHRKKLLRRVFTCLKQNHHGYVIKRQVAEDYYDLYVTQLVFRTFREAIGTVKKENEVKWQAMLKYYNSNIMFKIFTCWRTLPALNALQREQEARKARWRSKVLQVVPDYTPPDD